MTLDERKAAHNMGFAKVGLKNMFSAMGNSIELLYIGRINDKVRPRPGRRNSIAQPSQSPER